MARWEDEMKQEQFKNVTGSYARFTDVKGIGPAKASKIKNIDYSIETPKDVAEYSADELSDKAGISRNLAAKVIEGGGGNPNVSKVGNTGTVSAAGIQTRQGDFMVGFGELDKARAKNDARSRGEQAVRTDERKRAPVTTDYDQWKENPNKYDFPGVDTPTQNPDLLPKDLKKSDPTTTDFQARDEQEQERREQSYPQKVDAASGKENFILETGEERLLASEVANQEDIDDFGVFAEARDISLSPDEAFGGVGVVSDRELGGNVLGEGERAPTNLDEPPQEAIERQQYGTSKYLDEKENSPQAIASIYKGGDFDISLQEFGNRVRSKRRHSDLPGDMWGFANMVAKERGAYPAYRD